MAQKKLVKNKLPVLQDNDNLAVNFVDTFHVAVRSDNIALMKLYSQFSDGTAKEQVRLATTGDGVKKLIDLLCKTSKYYPIEGEEIAGIIQQS